MRPAILTTKIPLPQVVASGDARLAAWCNSVRTCLAALARSVPVANDFVGASRGTPPSHPFRIIGVMDVATPKIQVEFGQILGWRILKHGSAGAPLLQPFHDRFTVNSDNPANHPDGRTPVGEIALTAETTYGVWLRGIRGSGQIVLDSGAETGHYRINYEYSSTWEVIVDSSATNSGDKDAEDSYTWIFLGRAGYVSGAWEIAQHQRSDLCIPFATLPKLDASTDSGNQFSLGSDGLPFVSSGS